ncbi:hypothetical protein GGX14DRAFT_386038 [Mycena pura]|uniref:Uncharacterized protein n=1 Tax=Mycena pura TaxID=153505 RepID=A0AAD6YRT2_9AGAR|nr:hypothetical protein GGX14DRAFT_386038 [Mycena pura]
MEGWRHSTKTRQRSLGRPRKAVGLSRDVRPSSTSDYDDATYDAALEEFHDDYGDFQGDVEEFGGQEQWDEERYVLHHPAEYEDDEEPVYVPEKVVSQLSFDPETAMDAQIDMSAWGVHWFCGPPPGVSPDMWHDDMDTWRLRIEASLEAEAMYSHDDGCAREAIALPADDDMYDTWHFWDPARYDGDPHYGLSVTDNRQPPPSVRKYILEDQAALNADQVPDDRRKEFLEELRLLCEDERYYDHCRMAGFVWDEQCRERLLPLRLTYLGFELPPAPATSYPVSRRGRAPRSATPIFRHTCPHLFGSSTRRALNLRDAPTKHPPRRPPRRPPARMPQPVLQLSTVQSRPQSHSRRDPPPHLPMLSTTVSMLPLTSTSPAPPSTVRDRKEPMPPDRSTVTVDNLLDPSASSTSASTVRRGERPEDMVALPRTPKPPNIGALGTPSKPAVADGGVAQRRRIAAQHIARKVGLSTYFFPPLLFMLPEYFTTSKGGHLLEGGDWRCACSLHLLLDSLHKTIIILPSPVRISEHDRPALSTGDVGRVYGLIETRCRPDVAELKSQAGERLGVLRMITKGLDEVSECLRYTGETARRCGQGLWASRDWVQARCDRTEAIAKASTLRLAWGLVAEWKTCTATPVSRPEYRCARAQGR